MNWDVIEGKWKEMKGAVREKWGDLTEDELEQIAGKKDKLAGVLQQKYGKTKEVIDKEIDDWATERQMSSTN